LTTNTIKLGEGAHELTGITLSVEECAIDWDDEYIIECWDDDWPTADDLLFRGKLVIKNSYTEIEVSYLESNNLWFQAYSMYLLPPVDAYWPQGTDRDYASFDIYNWNPDVIDPTNKMWIEVTIDYYYQYQI